MLTYHFKIGQDHVLFRAKSYQNALVKAKKEASSNPLPLEYIGFSYGTFGKLYFSNKIFKFKGMKHSVHMRLLSLDKDGIYELENANYGGIFYKAKREELEEVR